MIPCKRIEIVIETPMARRLIRCLNEAGAPGYTMIPEIWGGGDRRIRRADELTGDSSNSLFLVACEDDAIVDKIVAAVQPLLVRSGGMCLVSDARWLRH